MTGCTVIGSSLSYSMYACMYLFMNDMPHFSGFCQSAQEARHRNGAGGEPRLSPERRQ